MLNFIKINRSDGDILDFRKFKFLPADTLDRSNLRKPAKFHQDRPIRCWDMANFRFFKISAVCHCGFFVRVFGLLTKSTWWSLSLCKKCRNRCTCFDNMQVLWFCTLGLKTPIHSPKLGFWGFWPLKWAQVTTGPPKSHIHARKHVVWRVCRENPFSVVGAARSDEWKKVHVTTKNMWSQNTTIFPLLFLFAFTTACLAYKPWNEC